MKHFLIVYDRQAGRLNRAPQEFGDSTEAIKARFDVERVRPDLEVVVVSAWSLDAIKRTHGRYFMRAALDIRGTA